MCVYVACSQVIGYQSLSYLFDVQAYGVCVCFFSRFCLSLIFALQTNIELAPTSFICVSKYSLRRWPLRFCKDNIVKWFNVCKIEAVVNRQRTSDTICAVGYAIQLIDCLGSSQLLDIMPWIFFVLLIFSLFKLVCDSRYTFERIKNLKKR